jgi:hypothetical protein
MKTLRVYIDAAWLKNETAKIAQGAARDAMTARSI